MCFFRKWREKRRLKKTADETKQNQLHIEDENIQETQVENEVISQSEEIKEPQKETVEKLKIRPFSKPKASNKEVEWPKKSIEVDDEETDEVIDAKEPEVESVPAIETLKEPKKSGRKYSGKYEVYPETDYFKYRLKASNGEILLVSFRYSSEKGALAGIETFKKNVIEGQFKVKTDKNHFSQFYLYNSNGARIIVVGELYQSVAKANSAIESVKSFYDTEKIEVLTEVPKTDIREESIQFDSVEESSMGKYEVVKEENLFYLRLKASNSQVLFKSQGYASKSSAKSGLNTIKNAIKDKNFTISRDKQNRYQFNIYSSSGQILVIGETYSAKSNGISAAHSVIKFGLLAEMTE